MTVREAAVDDVEAIREVATSSWETDYPDILSRESVEAGVDEWYSSDRLHETVVDPWPAVLLAEADGEVVGFVHATATGDEGAILRLYVDPDHRRDGHGRRLVEAIREELAVYDVDRISAMVLAENPLGNAFYRALGFEKTDEGETRIGGEPHPENRYVLEV